MNNAGFGTMGQFPELPIEREEQEIRLNVVAVDPAHARRAAGHDRASRRAACINVASIAAYQPTPRQRDLRRDQGVREQLHARPCTRSSRAPA